MAGGKIRSDMSSQFTPPETEETFTEAGVSQ